MVALVLVFNIISLAFCDEFRIKNKDSQLCMSEVKNPKDESQTLIIVDDCTTDATQLWTFKPVAGGNHIVNVKTKECLSVMTTSTTRFVQNSKTVFLFQCQEQQNGVFFQVFQYKDNVISFISNKNARPKPTVRCLAGPKTKGKITDRPCKTEARQMWIKDHK